MLLKLEVEPQRHVGKRLNSVAQKPEATAIAHDLAVADRPHRPAVRMGLGIDVRLGHPAVEVAAVEEVRELPVDDGSPAARQRPFTVGPPLFFSRQTVGWGRVGDIRNPKVDRRGLLVVFGFEPPPHVDRARIGRKVTSLVGIATQVEHLRPVVVSRVLDQLRIGGPHRGGGRRALVGLEEVAVEETVTPGRAGRVLQQRLPTAALHGGWHGLAGEVEKRRGWIDVEHEAIVGAALGDEPRIADEHRHPHRLFVG